MSRKTQIFTDSPQKLSQLFLEYEFVDIDFLKHLKTPSTIILTDKNRDFYNFQLLSHFVITTFESNFGDYFSTEKNLKNAIEYALSVIDRAILSNKESSKKKENNFLDDIIDEKNSFELSKNIDFLENQQKKQSEIDENSGNSISFIEKNSFQGVYVKNILMKEGHLKFFPSFFIWLSALKGFFSGEIVFYEQKTEIYKILMKKGVIIDIISRKKDDHLHSFLVYKGYIPKNSQFIEGEKELWSYLVSKDIFLSSDFHLIQHDYKLSLLKKILLLKDGVFVFKAINLDKNSPIFKNDIDTIFELARFLDFTNTFSDNQKFSILKNSKDINNTIAKKILEFISLGYDFKAIFWGVGKISNDDLNRYISLLVELDIITTQKKDEIAFTSGAISLNAEEKILIWMEKIKKDDYFDTLGVDIYDSIEYIRERYDILNKEFMRFFHIKNIFDKYHLELKEIIFYLDSAFNVLSNVKLKEKYYLSLNGD